MHKGLISDFLKQGYTLPKTALNREGERDANRPKRQTDRTLEKRKKKRTQKFKQTD